ncbi:hypothetical protein [Ekhidna sp.]|uniref:hypothetical protein n=1 Tax=Ekhidna sp. TaxID=2608089 RepID=UPI0035170C84
MNADAKLELINSIAKSKNHLLLEEIRKLIDLTDGSEEYVLSESQLAALKAAEEDVQYGKTLSQEEAKEATQKWFEK